MRVRVSVGVGVSFPPRTMVRICANLPGLRVRVRVGVRVKLRGRQVHEGLGLGCARVVAVLVGLTGAGIRSCVRGMCFGGVNWCWY